ncbi:hypothetical protein KSS87_002303 [Heliosperma pusillum]|nr:hypothetical protein KSS87_002303 [Heliosperma pusillum]
MFIVSCGQQEILSRNFRSSLILLYNLTFFIFSNFSRNFIGFTIIIALSSSLSEFLKYDKDVERGSPLCSALKLVKACTFVMCAMHLSLHKKWTDIVGRIAGFSICPLVPTMADLSRLDCDKIESNFEASFFVLLF